VFESYQAIYELEMLSPWFDNSAEFLNEPIQSSITNREIIESKKLLLLFSIPRNGSYHFCRLLWYLGYGKPAEYFNPHLMHGWKRYHKRDQTLFNRIYNFRKPSTEWLINLVHERTARSCFTNQEFFSVKIQPNQLRKSIKHITNTFDKLSRYKLWKPFAQEPPTILLLYRRDWLNAMLSHHTALCTGSFDQRRIFSYQQYPITCLKNPETIKLNLGNYRKALEKLVTISEDTTRNIYYLAFEDLLDNQANTLARLIRAIEPSNLLPNSLETSAELSISIKRSDNPWDEIDSSWRLKLHNIFSQENLHNHPDFHGCNKLIARLDEAQMQSHNLAIKLLTRKSPKPGGENL